MDLPGRIVSRQGEFLLFALTPPRLSTTPEKAQEIADITFERLDPLGVDGLILYDIDDEADRNPRNGRFHSCQPWTQPTIWTGTSSPGARRWWSTARRRSTARKSSATGSDPRTPPIGWPSSSVLPRARSVSPRRSAGPSSS